MIEMYIIGDSSFAITFFEVLQEFHKCLVSSQFPSDYLGMINGIEDSFQIIDYNISLEISIKFPITLINDSLSLFIGSTLKLLYMNMYPNELEKFNNIYGSIPIFIQIGEKKLLLIVKLHQSSI